MMDNEEVFKIIRTESNESFAINVKFRENSFTLEILQNLKAWIEEVEFIKISTLAQQFELSPTDYYTKIQEYFSNTPKNVDIKFTNSELVIYCKLENNMKVKYFFCKLKEVDYNKSVAKLLENCSSECIGLRKEIDEINQERDELVKRKINLESKLTEIIEREKGCKQQLYNSFVLLLNEKKKQIQHLNELLETFRRGRPTKNAKVDVKKNKTKKAIGKKVTDIEIKEEISESESENDSKNYDTDEEKLMKRDRLNDNDVDIMPSTSKQNFDIFLDDSPPQYQLPKRIKFETSESNISGSSSKGKVDSNKNNVEGSVIKSEENSPQVDFNTQDMLDLI